MSIIADTAIVLSESASHDYVTFKYVELVVLSLVMIAIISIPCWFVWFVITKSTKNSHAAPTAK